MSARRAPAGACMLVTLLVLGACGSSDAAPRCGDRPCTPQCTALSGANCDVRNRECQQRVLDAVVCVRGTKGLLPAVRTIDETQYRQELEQQAMPNAGLDAGAAADDGGERDAAASAQAPSVPDPWSRALKLLGLLSVQQSSSTSANIEDHVKNTAAFYSSSTRQITLIDRGVAATSDDEQRTLAHELVHALQDQNIGLPGLAQRGTGAIDGRFAHSCLVEGEAMLYEQLAWSLLQGLSIDEVYWQRDLNWQLKSAREHVLRSENAYADVWLLRYPIGERYLRDAFKHGGNWEIQALFEAEPLASVDWLVGYAENSSRRSHLVAPLACVRAAIPAGYKLYGEYNLGAAVLFAFVGHSLVDAQGVFSVEEQWRNAMHWRQDSLSIFTNDRGDTAVSYRIRFDDEKLAAAIGQRLAQLTSLLTAVRVHGAELEISSADVPTDVASIETDPRKCP